MFKPIHGVQPNQITPVWPRWLIEMPLIEMHIEGRDAKTDRQVFFAVDTAAREEC